MSICPASLWVKAELVAELPIEVAEEVAIVTKTLTERLSMLGVERKGGKSGRAPGGRNGQSLAAERSLVRAELATVKAQATAAEETHRVAEHLTKLGAGRDDVHKQAAIAREGAAELIQALSSHQPGKPLEERGAIQTEASNQAAFLA